MSREKTRKASKVVAFLGLEGGVVEVNEEDACEEEFEVKRKRCE